LGIGLVLVHGADHVLDSENRVDQVAAAVRGVSVVRTEISAPG
jgi:hypothetical protein